MARDFQKPFSLPDGATDLLLVRHGSAVILDSNAPLDVIDGHSDPPLTEAGHAQALAVSERLAGLPVSALFVTPLQRTAQTAAPIAERLGLEPTVIGDLREIHLGDWEGQLNARVAHDGDLSKEVFLTERWDVIPNAEPMEEFEARVANGIETVTRAIGPNSTGIAVVHGGVIAEACRQVTGSHAFAFLYAENCSITRIVRMPRGRWALLGFNDTAHLQGSATHGS